MRPLQLRIYLPFCPRKCLHCYSLCICSTDEALRKDYLQALKREILSACDGMEDYCIEAVLFEGGSPSLFSAEALGEILDALKDSFPFTEDVEIALEANPGSVTKESLRDLRKIGVNRIFLGMCTDQARQFKALGLPFDPADAKFSADAMHAEDFHSFSLDLLCGLPHQTLSSLQDTLLNSIALLPGMIRLQPLLLKQGSLYYERFVQNRMVKGTESLPALPSTEETGKMLDLADRELRRSGYRPQGLYTYSFPGYESKNRSWNGEYLGFGLGAKSCLAGIVSRNTEELPLYLEASDDPERCIASIGAISPREEQILFVQNALKSASGLSIQYFEESFKADVFRAFPQLEILLSEKRLSQKEDRLFMSFTGMADPLSVFKVLESSL